MIRIDGPIEALPDAGEHGEPDSVREAYDAYLVANPVPRQRVVPARDLVRRGGQK